jgi:hypothetical protein
MGDAVIRPNKKLCTCFSCHLQVPKGFSMLHLDKWGSRWTLCLPCILKLGEQAKEVMLNESIC